MKVLIAHNFYQQAGGEDEVFSSEARLLEQRGHAVVRFVMDNDEVAQMGRLKLAKATLWNGAARAKLADMVRAESPQVVHFHNTFPLMSPAVYSAARECGAAVVQTLHNFRLLCPSATFYRNGEVCEKCLHTLTPWPAVVHKCYRDSRAASAVTAAMLTTHRAIGTYDRNVDAYIALSNFARHKFIEGGLPSDKIAVKANFLDPDPGLGAGDGGYALFVGRLTPEKGVQTLLDAWKVLRGKYQLKIVGDGPMRTTVDLAAQQDRSIEYLGRRPLPEVLDLIGRARILVFPSQWYEGMPRTIVESFACGTPVVATDLGTMSEMITQGETGALVESGDMLEWAHAIQCAMVDPTIATTQRISARREFETKYTADINFRRMIRIYEEAIERRRGIVSGVMSGVAC